MTVLAIEKYGSGAVSNQYLSDNTIVHYSRRRWSSAWKVFQQIFLPQGYPDSVSRDYIAYQLWDTLQAFASSITGTLASQAMLKGYGVGDEKATVLAATITWLMRDGAGMVGRIVFAYSSGIFLDCDCKRWRFFADILNDGAICLELMAPWYKALFTPIVCVASVAKSIVGVAGGATRAAIGVHQARRNNMADVAAKDGSQETMVNLVGLVFNFAFIHMVTGNTFLTWISFAFFTCIHLFANFRAVSALQMETFNLTRFLIFTREYLRSGGRRILSVSECNNREPVILPLHRYKRLSIGVSFSHIKNRFLLSDIISLFSEEDFLIVPNTDCSSVGIVLHDHCTDVNMLKAVFAAEIFFHLREASSRNYQGAALDIGGLLVEHCDDDIQIMISTLKVTRSLFDAFIRRAHGMGWELSPVLLGADEWRADWRLT